MKKNIVFDFGGVVFRWRPHEVLRRALPHRVPDETAARRMVQDFFGGPDGEWIRFDRGTVDEPELARLMALRLGLAEDEVHAVINSVPHELEPQAGTVALMQRLLDAGHRLFYLSNMPAPYADHLERNHGFLERFTDGLFSARVKLVKPEPEIYALANQRFDIDPAETVFIDDMAVNVQAARAHGWQAVQFFDPLQCEAELTSLISV